MRTATLLAPEEWREAEQRHRERARTLTAGHRERRSRGEKHAIEDFLFTYYPLRPGHLERWSPGVGVGLAGAATCAERRWFTVHDGVTHLDVPSYLADRGSAVRYHSRLLRALAQRAASYSCFGLHEWAMVYRASDRRHPLPLRLGQEGTDAVVEDHRIACSHYDAFRFFTPEAIGRNTLAPSRERQVEMDQPGCLHVGMDLLKTVIHLGPAVPGEVMLDVFEHARALRELDMRASPYDVSAFGLSAVAIETPEGKATYVAAQRALAEVSAALRERLLAVLDRLEEARGTNVPA